METDDYLKKYYDVQNKCLMLLLNFFEELYDWDEEDEGVDLLKDIIERSGGLEHIFHIENILLLDKILKGNDWDKPEMLLSIPWHLIQKVGNEGFIRVMVYEEMMWIEDWIEHDDFDDNKICIFNKSNIGEKKRQKLYKNKCPMSYHFDTKTYSVNIIE